MIQITVWNENVHEQTGAIRSVYPDGIHGCIAACLSKYPDFRVQTATLDMPEQGLPAEVLDSTDVLIWWGHRRHSAVTDELAARIAARVQAGMGSIFLHSAHLSKPFLKLMGTTGSLLWKVEEGIHERLWAINPSHPIARGVSECVFLAREEMYGEWFDIPIPDEQIFIGWFSTGHVFRSGNLWNRGQGKVFYFQPGHESYPIYHNPDIQKIIANAVTYVAPPCM